MIYRCIAPDWALKNVNSKVLEGEFSEDQIKVFNAKGYNIYYLPNYPKNYNPDSTVTGADVDCFSWVFVDCDLKDGVYNSKEEFIEQLAFVCIEPTRVVDSGNGVHAYWKISDLDAKSYLRFQRRLLRLFNTDEAVGQLFQLMRVPGTLNTKKQDNQILCETLFESDAIYTSEEFDKLLPQITLDDENYCIQHYNKTHNIDQEHLTINPTIPSKFGTLMNNNSEAKSLWADNTDDRSKADYRLGHIMFAHGFSTEEAMSVLVNSAKASTRSPIHRHSYAENIVKAIWTFEMEPKKKSELSMSVKELLQRPQDTAKGLRFPLHPRIDNTHHGFRLGQVIGLVAGSGVGKTAFAMNLFRWAVESNPEYHHFFVPLEQPANEIAERWVRMSNGDEKNLDKVQVISNYDDDGNFRHLTFDEIKDYILTFQKQHDIKVGCVVIDHIGALKKKSKDGKVLDLADICHEMKAFAVQTNSLLIMQSQTSREKAGIGDLELDKDAAYGTVYFESYCDYLITLWQPLKRCHNEASCPTITAFKFCKIRHKRPNKDVIHEDVCYHMYFDSDTEQLRDMTQDETKSFTYFLKKATGLRNIDKKSGITTYQSVGWK